MATIHRATLTPTKPQLLAQWVPSQPWGGAGPEVLGAYRFDDPDGAVGIETILVRVDGGEVLQVPLTYRGAAWADGERSLIGTMEHSALGRRWVYDGCGDPVYARVLADVLSGAGQQAQEYVEDDPVPREPSVRVSAHGTSAQTVPPVGAVVATSDGARSVIEAGDVRLIVLRRLEPGSGTVGAAATLTGTWAGAGPTLLATLG